MRSATGWLGVLLFLLVMAPVRASGEADWTVMIFMNGDNNLDQDALQDLVEMSLAGSSTAVNVVVQMDRADGCLALPCWSRTMRRRIANGGDVLPNGQPVPPRREETADIGKEPGGADGEVNMGDPAALRAFVEWARQKYPARREALIIWDHGQGWRGTDTGPKHRQYFTSSSGAAYKSISFDDTDGDELYNAEIVAALAPLAARKRFDVLGFDACLMAMVETAYAVRDLADVMVASEELEPGTGWRYDNWLPALLGNPAVDARGLGKLLVDSYDHNYSLNPRRAVTLSAVDVKAAQDVAMRVSDLGATLLARLDTEKAAVTTARSRCEEYAPDILGDGIKRVHHIDVQCLAERLQEASDVPQVDAAAAAVRDAVQAAVVRNYASPKRRGAWGSHGLAIYFPKTLADYKADPAAAGGAYSPTNDVHPVAFVRAPALSWAKFLAAYWSRP